MRIRWISSVCMSHGISAMNMDAGRLQQNDENINSLLRHVCFDR